MNTNKILHIKIIHIMILFYLPKTKMNLSNGQKKMRYWHAKWHVLCRAWEWLRDKRKLSFTGNGSLERKRVPHISEDQRTIRAAQNYYSLFQFSTVKVRLHVVWRDAHKVIPGRQSIKHVLGRMPVWQADSPFKLQMWILEPIHQGRFMFGADRKSVV